jgi:hypothetical protein
MNFNPPRYTSVTQTNLTRLRAAYVAWPQLVIAALGKRAGEAGNRRRFDLGARPRYQKWRMNHELKSC